MESPTSTEAPGLAVLLAARCGGCRDYHTRAPAHGFHARRLAHKALAPRKGVAVPAHDGVGIDALSVLGGAADACNQGGVLKLVIPRFWSRFLVVSLF